MNLHYSKWTTRVPPIIASYLSKTNMCYLNGVAYLLILLTAIKIFLVVFSSPIMGYANNGDFIRQSSCTGLWQHYHNKPTGSASSDQTVNLLYLDGNKVPDTCMGSIDNFFPSLAAALHSVGDKVDFREVAFWKAASITLAAAILLLIFSHPGNRIAYSIVCFLVLGDIANLLFLNTFYLEFSVVSGCFLCLSIMAFLVSTPRRPSILIFALSILSLVWLGLSKHQYMPLASIFSLFISLIFLARWRAKKSALIFTIISLAIPIIYGQVNSTSGNINEANRWANMANNSDTYLGAVLPAAHDKKSALDILGLPDSCSAEIGKDWYSGIDWGKPACPEVEKVSRLRLLKLFIIDPSTFFTPMYRQTLGISPYYPSHLTLLEKPLSETSSLTFRVIKETSLSTLWAKADGNFAKLVNSLTLVIFPMFMIVLFVINKIKCGAEFGRLAHAMFWLGWVTALYAIASSVFGDGYPDGPKHAVAFMIGTSFEITGAALVFVYQLVSKITWAPSGRKIN